MFIFLEFVIVTHTDVTSINSLSVLTMSVKKKQNVYGSAVHLSSGSS